MNEKRRKMLDEVLKEAASNCVVVDGWNFRIGFATKLNDVRGG